MHFDERVVTGEKPKGKQGFASMDRDRVKAIASKGGRAIHRLGLAHQWTSQTAAAAGRKGAKRSAEVRKKSVA